MAQKLREMAALTGDLGPQHPHGSLQPSMTAVTVTLLWPPHIGTCRKNTYIHEIKIKVAYINSVLLFSLQVRETIEHVKTDET